MGLIIRIILIIAAVYGGKRVYDRITREGGLGLLDVGPPEDPEDSEEISIPEGGGS